MYPNVFIATIPSGDGTSDAVDLRGNTLVGIATPSALTNTALTLLVSADGGAYNQLYDKGATAFSITVAASRFVGFKNDDIAQLKGVRYIKLVGMADEAAERKIQLVAGPA